VYGIVVKVSTISPQIIALEVVREVVGNVSNCFAPKARAVASNESSEVVGIIKPGRRSQLRGHVQ